LMDIHLKGEMTGIEVSKRVKADFNIPIVYLTANADIATFEEANQTDPYAYLLKPFGERELGIAIEIALRKHKKEQIVRSSEYWYAIAFQSLSEAVMATDRHGDIVFMNALAESMTGWTLKEALDRPLADILQFQRKIRQFDDVENKSSADTILDATLEGAGVVPLPHGALLRGRRVTNQPEPAFATIPITGRAVAIKDATGQITGSLFTFEEIASETKISNEISRKAPFPLPEITQRKEHSARIATQEKEAIDQKEVDGIKSFIEAFVNQQPTAYFSSVDLFASDGEAIKTLTSRMEGTVITGKLVRDNLTAIVSRDSMYWEAVCHALIENSFFPVSQRTNGTCYFQHCSIPKDCQVYRTNALELWDVWHGKPCPGSSNATEGIKVARANLVVLRRGSWYHIKSMGLSGNIIKIATVAGELFISTTDLIVWGTQLWH